VIRSLRVRFILAGGTLSLLFMVGLLPALQSAFGLALRESIQQRLASDVTTLISAAQVEGNQLHMPTLLPDEQFNLPDSRLLGYIYDRNSNLVWQSRATHHSDIHYTPRYDGLGTVFTHIHEVNGVEYFVYDVEVKLLAGKNAAYSFVAVQPVEDYQRIIQGLRERLWLGFGAALLALLLLLWGGLTWG
jgi:two-component system sensor histidine kinase PhoQ